MGYRNGIEIFHSITLLNINYLIKLSFEDIFVVGDNIKTLRVLITAVVYIANESSGKLMTSSFYRRTIKLVCLVIADVFYLS